MHLGNTWRNAKYSFAHMGTMYKVFTAIVGGIGRVTFKTIILTFLLTFMMHDMYPTWIRIIAPGAVKVGLIARDISFFDLFWPIMAVTFYLCLLIDREGKQ